MSTLPPDEQQQMILKTELVTRFGTKPELEKFQLQEICFRGEPLDCALQRFLQARKFDVDATEKCITDSIRWRRENASKYMQIGKAGCLGTRVEEVTNFYGGGYAGFCKEGRPIWYEETGAVDIEGLHAVTTDEKFAKYHICLMEELQDKYFESSERFKTVINKTVTILNLDGVTVSKLNSEALAFVKLISSIDSANYPETMGKMFIINAPSLFSFAWRAIQGYLDPRTVSKISVLGTKDQWLPALLEFVEQSELPVELGGTYTGCGALKCFKEETLSSGGVILESSPVKEGQIIYYKFFVRDGREITFELSITDANGKKTPLFPQRELLATECSGKTSMTDAIAAPCSGTVEARWTHPNWWTRTVVYRMCIE